MDKINKTLYIPLYGKALCSQKGIIINDPKAKEIWESQKFALGRKSKSKWLAYYMGMRSKVFDEWVEGELEKHPESIVLHLGCGLDSRVKRVNAPAKNWYDVDFSDVICERERYYEQTETYKMLSADLKDLSFVDSLPHAPRAIVVMEGVSMYLKNEEVVGLLSKIKEKFSSVSVLVDCYTPLAAKLSKIKNPIKEVGVSNVYGVSAPSVLVQNSGLSFVKEHAITPIRLIEQLSGAEKSIFKFLYAGKTSKKLYKLYEYES